MHAEKYHNVFHIQEKESGFLYFRDLELHTIELKKFSTDVQAELSDLVTKIKNSLDMWVAFLTRFDLLNKEHLPKELDNPALKKALGVLEVMNFDPEEREAYEAHLKWLRVEANTLKKYEAKGFEEGKIEGKIEGERAMLLRQLTRKFTEVSERYCQKLITADHAQLSLWSDRILAANSIEEIFGE